MGGDQPVLSTPSRHKSLNQRIQEELAEARALEDALKLAPANVRINLSPAGEEEMYERQRGQVRLNAYGPEPLSYDELYYGTPEKFHG